MDAHSSPYILHFMVGALVVSTFLLKAIFRKIGLPSLVGFLLLGLALGLVNGEFHLISVGGGRVLEFLANVGLIILLFRTGLEGDTKKLKEEFGPASLIWFGNFFLSGIFGFIGARYFLGLPLTPSLVIATAFTATSIAVSIGIWREAGVMNRRESNLLLNVAQMDDVSGIAALALLLALIPMIGTGETLANGAVLGELGIFAFSLTAFSVGCILFARYVEGPMTTFFESIGTQSSCLMLMTAGTGVMIAAIAEGMGLSLAVGALFAGLVFSQNPDTEEIDKMLIPLYDLFVPFFFIGIGLSINPNMFISGFAVGIVLLIPAVLGKVIGGFVPALRCLGTTGALALGISLVPRAEIMLVIAESAKKMGTDIISDEIFAGLVFISAITCILTPALVNPLFKKLKSGSDGSVSDDQDIQSKRKAA